MMNNGKETTCGFYGDIVAYMYGEASAKERTAFESHLVGCTACTDEFAEISLARYSVYEWQKEEFAPLATPEIVIPYPQAQHAVETAAATGSVWSPGDWFAWARWPVTAAASLLVVIGVAAVSMFYLGGAEQQIAANVKDEATTALISQAAPSTAAVTSTENEPGGTTAVSKRPESAPPEVRTAKVVAKSQPSKTIRAATTETRRTPKTRATPLDSTVAVRSNDIPVLNSYDDDDDRSLRLTDLVDDDGTRQ